MNKVDDYLGRLFVAGQLPKEIEAKALSLDSMYEIKGQLFCQRCASLIDPEIASLPVGATYCRACLLLGRVRSDRGLYYLPQQAFEPGEYLIWQGRLTSWQEGISKRLLEAVGDRRNCLVHAVTGAGKTEMIYQVIDRALRQGQAVCLASPRIDVCIELHKRLSRDFSCPIALLHGEGEAYFRTPLVIATTHQLLKFYKAFDLLIIDEVDAFPYVDNAMLYHAVDQVMTDGGCQIFLTATSTDELDRKVQKGDLTLLRLPRRFHENPLVVPKKVWLANFERDLSKGKLGRRLLRDLVNQRRTGYPLLIFAPEISLGQDLVRTLEAYFPGERIGFVSSQTLDRLDQVAGFREGQISILVSTTILERGVTFPKVDVFVLEAHHRLYTKASLVQIGGRVGRSMERPTGLLNFYQSGTTIAIEKAIAEIKLMNQESGLG